MILHGQLYAESPIYRGNGRKALFTRDGDGTQRLVSLAGEIAGTAQSLMDAFIGESRDRKNIGLLNRLWLRLYGDSMPSKLITHVECKLREDRYPRDRFFDLRMGMRLDEDRWAAEANANYKMETLFRNSVFNLSILVDDAVMRQSDNAAKLYFMLQELKEGRFRFGAGKSKGLGQCRLEMDLPFSAKTAPAAQPKANHLRLSLSFNAGNPLLVGWNWGKVDPHTSSFAAIDGRLLVGAMKEIPEPIRSRLELSIGGPILSPADWKNKFSTHLPRIIAIWLREQSGGETEVWLLPSSFLPKLTKGKYPVSQDALDAVQPLCDKPYARDIALEIAIKNALGKKANMTKRFMEGVTRKREASNQLNEAAWSQVAQALGLNVATDLVATKLNDESVLTTLLADACRPILPRLNERVDQHIALLQSDVWVDAELTNREGHLQIKVMLLEGKIDEAQWEDRNRPPAGINAALWRTFLEEHSRVRHSHMLHPANLRKSITNDRNFIAFLTAHRAKTRQELAQPHHIDFRAGGAGNREISQQYGKPYDKIFMRMLNWSPKSATGEWQIYIAGGTIKGAFRKRASQILKTLWGESPKTNETLDRLFGAQRRQGLLCFSDAYLADATDTERAWCSMDGVKMDPSTGQPVETAKTDCLYAYGDRLVFNLSVDMQDVDDRDLEALSVFSHLLEDFQKGEIPVGGEKTNGLGWVKASVAKLEWLTANVNGVSAKLFSSPSYRPAGLWQKYELSGDAAAGAFKTLRLTPTAKIATNSPKTSLGFTSHRSFGGYCGALVVEAEILTPTNVRESGQPSFTTTLPDGAVNGWDFFAMASPSVELRDPMKTYALPSRSLKGMVRNLYAIASDSIESSPNIQKLNPTDSLFGWVGTGPNQAIMGRLAFSFGMFDRPELAWFKIPYPYGKWKNVAGEWQTSADTHATQLQIARTWRIFPHTPIAPPIKRLDGFNPDTVQASYLRAILPGARARFTIRFWNLDETELQRLIWCLALEPGLAHKIGCNRYLGLGSLRLTVLPESYLTQWENRYAGKEWRAPLNVETWIKPKVVEHYNELVKAMNVKRI
ncbi:MAG TPA: RAMP superfamily CRISPR-associated protein [Rhodocyclaceae bacterium]|nr:RAMP superfamily CRISPR-associated protein [Rhodocyclaceae bacterium]